jgi:hypothetical protein
MLGHLRLCRRQVKHSLPLHFDCREVGLTVTALIDGVNQHALVRAWVSVRVSPVLL